MKSFKNQLVKIWCPLLLLLGVNGCTDHEVSPETTPVAVKNERLILASTMLYEFANIKYNPDGTPKSYDKVKLYESVTIQYLPDMVIYETSEKGKLIGKEVYQLKNGVAEKIISYLVDGNGKETEYRTRTYSYKSGKLDKEMFFENGQLLSYNQYAYNGDNIAYIQQFVNGKPVSKDIFEYTSIPDKSGSLNRWHYMDGTLFPRKSKNLVKKEVTEENGLILYSYVYDYVLDGQGYVVSSTSTDKNGFQESWMDTWQ